MDFSQALGHMRAGELVSRKSWREDVYLNIKDNVLNINSRDTTSRGWGASSADIMADDWQIANPYANDLEMFLRSQMATSSSSFTGSVVTRLFTSAQLNSEGRVVVTFRQGDVQVSFVVTGNALTPYVKPTPQTVAAQGFDATLFGDQGERDVKPISA